MTIFSSLTTDTNQLNHSHGPVSAARVVETSDAAASTATTYDISVGDTFAGNLSTGDRDWIAIDLLAGEINTFNLEGSDSGSGTLSDPYLRLYNSAGEMISSNDDNGDNLNSTMVGSVDISGTYYISAGSYRDRYAGTYELSVTAGGVSGPVPVLGTLDELATYLTDGFWTDNSYIRHSFDTSASNIISVNLTGLTAAGQQLARWAFDAWEMVADILFEETTNTSADMRFQDHDSGAYSSSHNVVGGDTGYSIVNVSTAWLSSYGTTVDSYSLQTYLHEIGHALGLGHQGDYNGSATYGVDNTFSNDSWQLSLMSYFSQSENTETEASRALVLTPMMADIIAIQDLYGAANGNSETAGDTVWGASSSLGGPLGEYFTSLTSDTGTYNGSAVAFTIYDTDGTDTLDTSPIATANRIDMRGGYFSDVAGLIGNIGVAGGTLLENLISGSGNDTVTGNAADNDINLGDGDNLAYGKSGNDSITGATGADKLYGEDGMDRLFGGLGDDTLSGGNDADKLHGQAGMDSLYGGSGNDTLSGGNDADKLYGQDGADDLYGGLGNDTLSGGNDADKLYGQDGIDRLFGGSGNDTLSGGNDADKLYGEDGLDRLFGGLDDDTLSGGNDADKLYGEDGFDCLFGGLGNDTLSGGNGADKLYGQDGADSLFGGLDNDTLSGGTNSDRLYGNEGSDRLFGEDGTDRLFGGDGNDLLHGGAHNDRLYGEDGADRLIGGTGNDYLLGNSGADRLEGEDGADILIGGTEADIFVFTDGTWADRITDFSTLEGDRVMFTDVTTLATFTDVTVAASHTADGLLIDTGNGGSVLLEGLLLTDLDVSDFLF
jgi:serralysin